jgi:hypothetical protein
MNAIPMPSSFPGKKADVSTQSGERAAMDADISLIGDILAGADAMRARSARYLPQYEMESAAEYKRRVAMAPWRPEFADCLQTLASKPFAKDVTVAETASPAIKTFADDVDGRGNNLSVFARRVFISAMAYGVHAVLVDYPVMPANVTLATEKAIGAKPYLVSIPVSSIIAIRTERRGGREVVVHVRFREDTIEPDDTGFGEVLRERIRVIEPGAWQLWEAQRTSGGQVEWVMKEKGAIRWNNGETPSEVPLVLFFTGERKGEINTKSPFRDLADVQIELFRALSRQDEILTFAGSPMLAATGMAKPEQDKDSVKVGPKTILFAPPTDGGKAEWQFISPDAAAMREIREQVQSVTDDLRRLGMQPMTQRSGGITATATSVETAKAHSALEAWAMGLKDALEQAFVFVGRWLGEPKPTVVEVYTDFAAGDQSVEEGKVILAAQAATVISRRTAAEELHRRGLLGPSFDPVKEETRIAEEMQGLEPEFPIDPVTGFEITQTQEGAIN